MARSPQAVVRTTTCLMSGRGQPASRPRRCPFNNVFCPFNVMQKHQFRMASHQASAELAQDSVVGRGRLQVEALGHEVRTERDPVARF